MRKAPYFLRGRIAREYATRRLQFRKQRLNWRKSGGVRRSLGWVPFKSGAASWKHGHVYHNGQHFQVWDSYGLGQYRFRFALWATRMVSGFWPDWPRHIGLSGSVDVSARPRRSLLRQPL